LFFLRFFDSGRALGYHARFTLRVPIGSFAGGAAGRLGRLSMARGDARFDAFKLAGSRATIGGRLDPSELPRLEDRVAERGGHVDWAIEGTEDVQGRPAISVKLAGIVPLTCQRCLGSLEQEVGQSTRLLLARDDAELVRLDEASEDEVVLANGPLDPVALVEDELLLTLPFAPRHEASCAPQVE
jgi:uncharacterized protein